MNALVQIATGSLTATISPFGAELQSLQDSSGREYMTDADPAFWTGHAPLLFPIVGRLNGDVLRVDGREYGMKQHGFARKLAWELVGASKDSAAFRLRDTPETQASYPFGFQITAEYTITDATLSMTVRITNTGDRVMPASFGFHPAFAWPLPDGGAKSDHRLEFGTAEPAPIRRLNSNGLLEFSELSPVSGRSLPLDPGLFAADAMIWDRLASTALTYRSTTGGPALEIGFEGMPYLGIWQKPGANFICIEPWAGHADPAGFAGELREKPGITLLHPQEECRFSMDVTVVPD